MLWGVGDRCVRVVVWRNPKINSFPYSACPTPYKGCLFVIAFLLIIIIWN